MTRPLPPARVLPSRPNLDHLRGQAKVLLSACRSHDADALRRINSQLPRPEGGAVRLADAQLVLAREHGFASWPRLTAHVQALARAAASPADDLAAALPPPGPRALRGYQDVLRAAPTFTVEISHAGKGGTILETAHFVCARPNRMHVTQRYGAQYRADLVCDGQAVWLWDGTEAYTAPAPSTLEGTIPCFPRGVAANYGLTFLLHAYEIVPHLIDWADAGTARLRGAATRLLRARHVGQQGGGMAFWLDATTGLPAQVTITEQNWPRDAEGRRVTERGVEAQTHRLVFRDWAIGLVTAPETFTAVMPAGTVAGMLSVGMPPELDPRLTRERAAPNRAGASACG